MIRLVRLFASLTLMSLILWGCGANTQADGAHVQHARTDGMPIDEPADYTLYDLPTEWTDQSGSTRTLASFAGRPHVIALVYTSCTVACPRIVSDMKRLEGELGARAGEVGLIMVSIDPARDTPTRLREYAEAAHLDPRQWTLLTATDDAVLELAVLLGVRYRRVSDTDMEHSNVLTVLDAAGRIVHRQLGLGTDPAASVRVLTSLLEHAHTSAHPAP